MFITVKHFVSAYETKRRYPVLKPDIAYTLLYILTYLYTYLGGRISREA